MHSEHGLPIKDNLRILLIRLSKSQKKNPSSCRYNISWYNGHLYAKGVLKTLDLLETFRKHFLDSFINGLYSVAFTHKNQTRRVLKALGIVFIVLALLVNMGRAM